MKMIVRAASAAFLLFAAATTALANNTPLTQSAWSSALGSSATQLQALSGTVCVYFSISAPAAPTPADSCDLVLSAGAPNNTMIAVPPAAQSIYAKAIGTGDAKLGVTSSPFTLNGVAGTQEQDVTESRTLNAASTSSQQTYTLNGQSTLSFNFTGLAASGATVSFYQSNDWNGTTGTFTGISEVNTGTGVPSLTRTTDGQSAIGIEGNKAIRIQVTTAGTGTITLATNISVRSRYQALRAPLPPGGNLIGSVFPMPGTAWTQAPDISCTASTVCSLLITTSRKYLTITNTTATGYCRIAYGGLTPTATRGDPLGPAAVASGQGGGRTFESSYTPPGAVNAFCTVNSTLAVGEGN